MPDATSLLIDCIHSSLNNTEKITVSLLQSLKSHVIQYKKNGQDLPFFTRFLGLNYLLIFLFFPWYLFYWCYVYPLWFIYTKFRRYLKVPIKILRRRSHLFNALVCHIAEILSIADLILQKVLTSKISELLAVCISTAIEISLVMIWPFQQAPPVVPVPPEKSTSVNDISELVYYEELSPDDAVNLAGMNRKSTSAMHNYIPPNPFRATVRVKKPPRLDDLTADSTLQEGRRMKPVYQRIKTSYSSNSLDGMPMRASPPTAAKSALTLLKFIRQLPSSLISLLLEEKTSSSSNDRSGHSNSFMFTEESKHNQNNGSMANNRSVSPVDDTMNAVIVPDIDVFNIDSPASFPSSPFSRAYVMNRASERVVSVMFAARDQLRLEAQSVSRDEYSRMAAREAQTRGQIAVFDSRQVSAGIALTCGNHCAVKVGKGLVCSCRGMIPVRPQAFVYFEISVTVSSNQSPHLAIGLAPLDSPLNVMVGSWARSVGLYYDGQIMVGSRWFPSLSQASSHKASSDDVTSTTAAGTVSSSTGDRISAGSTVGILVYLPSGGASLTEHTVAMASQEHQQPELACPPPHSQAYSQALSTSRDRSQSTSSTSNVARSRTVSMAAATAVQLSHPLVHFNINGQPVRYSDDVQEALKEEFLAPSSGNISSGMPAGGIPPLFPTVSLFSEDTRVWCRFCEADIVYRDRNTIRAPPGARVYCLDGSLLLSERE